MPPLLMFKGVNQKVKSNDMELCTHPCSVVVYSMEKVIRGDKRYERTASQEILWKWLLSSYEIFSSCFSYCGV